MRHSRFIAIAPAIDPAETDAVRHMTKRMRPRGPDAEGLWSGAGAVLGHRRLAILDLDVRANQPLVSMDGRYTNVFNGEIYNFRELRLALESENRPKTGFGIPVQTWLKQMGKASGGGGDVGGSSHAWAREVARVYDGGAC